MEQERIYLCIDLKSFYASVECVERGLDPFTTNLVVADPERTDKTICLAVSPALKKLGVRNRCRVFEIPKHIPYLTAPPRMQKYIERAADVYGIYLQYIAKDEIFVYSIDEAFLDVTFYLGLYRMSARQLAERIMADVYAQTGLPAACGIGTNLYLAKIALDITAKHAPDSIGYLDEALYRETLWDHRPLTDFWRIGPGSAARLARYGIDTMRGIAQADEALLHGAFGVDAALLIDHAWGRESVTIQQIKAYRAKSHSISSGQVIAGECGFDRGLLLVREMADMICLELADKGLVTGSVTLMIGFSDRAAKPAVGTERLTVTTNSQRLIMDAFERAYRRIVPKNPSVKRIGVSANDVVDEALEQYDLFTDPEQLARERKIQHTVLGIKKKYGKNAILRGMNLREGATGAERNLQIGGHKSGEEQP